MSAAALAATPAAPHTPPHHAAAGARTRGGGLTVKVPLRLVVGAQYPDAALSVYVKIAALAQGRMCEARVATLAAYLGMSKSALERALRILTQPDPVDGIVEVPSRRRAYPDGRGRSAERSVRPLTAGELWVRIPVRAAEALTPRLLRLYALLAYATARRIPATAAELGEMLHHHTGKRAGESLGERQARRLVDELETTGWLTVHRREGERGRHAYETHRHPLHSVPTPATPATPASPAVPSGDDVLEDQGPEQLALFGPGAPVIHDGSGPGDHDGSLASEEDQRTGRRDEAEVGGGIRRRRGDRKWAADPVDNPVPDTFGRGGLGLRPDDKTAGAGPAGGRPAYTGPVLQLAPRIWRVLEPVHHELPKLSPFVLRKLAREIGAQLDAPGGSEQRLTDRLTRRYASTETIRDVGRWLLGAALVRHGCGLPDCESGTHWPTGQACEVCAVNRQVARAREQRERELAAREQQQRAQRLAEDLERQAYRAAGRARAQLLQDLRGEPLPASAVYGPAGPAPVLSEARPLPAKKTYRQRERATDEEILAAIAAHGPSVALHIYGHLRTLPLLSGRPALPREES